MYAFATDRNHSSTVAALVALMLLSSGCGDARQTSDVAVADPPTVSQSAKTEGDTDVDGLRPPTESVDDQPVHGSSAQREPNRLAKETSPYLLMHAHNPVNWYPWGEEALAKAKRENKLIFLSIGYSSCHWCHVMERESFMDDEIAALLNEHFVCIKVDREERPDLDTIYMTAVLLYTGRGGWPMSVFLTPDARPFFGGTYFPARDGDRPGTVGFLTVVQKLRDVWQAEPQKVTGNADQMTKLVQQHLDGGKSESAETLDQALIERLQEQLAERYDAQYGGFGYSPVDPARPKFPEPSNLLFLIHRIDNDSTPAAAREQATAMLTGTLDGLARGGIRDHIGGGFHRYSVDRYWRIPHFEKMLYDNGQLATVYAEAYRITGREDYRRVVDEMFQFLTREMMDDAGAFYAAIDADSEGVEGKFYRWSKSDAESLVGPEDWELFAGVYGFDRPPNFEHEYYVPQFSKTFAELAADPDVRKAAGSDEGELTETTLDQRMRTPRDKLLAVRDRRPRPLIDTKILTAWNGLMIRGLADAGRVLENQQYIDAASRAADFVLSKLRTAEGRLLRTYSQGEAKIDAYLDDYAMLVDGLIALHTATGEQKWLDAADELTQTQIELFWNDQRGGFFFTSDDHETLISRASNPADGARPAGNSVAAGNLIRLAKLVERPDYLDRAEQTIRASANYLTRQPVQTPCMATALSELLSVRPLTAPTVENEPFE